MHELPDPSRHSIDPSDVPPYLPLTLPSPPETRLDPDILPIEPYRDEIVHAIQHSDVVIITAETGAGKSTKVPQYLLDEGFSVVVTEPRRLAASALAHRVAFERGEEIGESVGFAHSLERIEGPNTRLRYCTDGYELVRELTGTFDSKDVLIIDEIHEWDIPMEVLLPWVKRQQEEGQQFKVVIMSATLHAEALSEYFGGAPTIRVPGRLFPIEDRAPGASMVDDAARLSAEGHDVLMFLPGKREIAAAVRDLEARGVRAELIPLHGQLSAEEQARAFESYPHGKIVIATNIAQTSLTIPGITAVVDSGLQRRIEVDHGVECLDVFEISQADALQRRGRAGRTAPGIYIYHGPRPIASLTLEPVPEIQRALLDQTVLRLLNAGVPPEDLRFFHEPPDHLIDHAYDTLRRLGLITKTGRVTKEGRNVAALPCEVHLAKMLLHAKQLDHEVPGVLDAAISVAAIVATGGIVRPGSPRWKRFCKEERGSDLLRQLHVYQRAVELGDPSPEALQNRGINERNFDRAREMERLLRRRLQLPEAPLHQDFSEPLRTALLTSVWSGFVDSVYRRVNHGWTDGNGMRMLPSDSVLHQKRLITGIPFNLGKGSTPEDSERIPLILLASEMDPKWYRDHAPSEVKKAHPTLSRSTRSPRHPGDKKDRQVHGTRVSRARRGSGSHHGPNH